MVSTSSNRGCGTVAARPLCMRKVRGSTPRISSNLRMVTCSIHVGCFIRTYSSEVERSIAELFYFCKYHIIIENYPTTKWNIRLIVLPHFWHSMQHASHIATEFIAFNFQWLLQYTVTAHYYEMEYQYSSRVWLQNYILSFCHIHVTCNILSS